MKLLFRLKSGPLCYTVDTWAHLNSIFSICLCVGMVFLFSWLADTQDIDPNTNGKTVLIILAVIFAIETTFYLIQLVGLLKRIKILLKIFLYCTVVSIVLILILFTALGIMLATDNSDNVASGFVLIGVGIFYAGILYYTILATYTVMCEIQDDIDRRNQLQIQVQNNA